MIKILLLVVSLTINYLAYAQVGINTENPNSLAELEITNATDASGGIIPKGIMIPRMTKEQRNKIDVSNSVNINSLMVYNTDDDCYNYYSRTSSEWKSLCGALGNVVFTIDCNSVEAKGNYLSNTDLTTDNYITIKVTVNAPGTYDITAMPKVDNGYNFYVSGQFLSKGNYTIKIPGFGAPDTPTASGSDGDQIIIKNNGKLICDDVYINVKNSSLKPDYSMSCNSIVVNGNYSAGTLLNSSNTIQFQITSPSTSIGAVYEFSTNTVNGYSFSASGTITSVSQMITLLPLDGGVPKLNETDKFVISSNSTSSDGATCEASIKVATRKIKILSLASADDHYDLGRPTSLANQALASVGYYFGPGQDAIYPVSGFEFLSKADINISATVSSFAPDIIVVGYNWTASNPSDIIALTNFVNNGGVLIYCSDGDAATSARNVAAQNLVRSIFDNTTMTVTDAETNIAVYNTKTIQNTNTMITNGPFMNLTGLSLGRDSGNNFDFNIAGFPYNDANVIVFNSSSNTAIYAFSHKKKGFLFVGDGGALGSTALQSAFNWPVRFELQASLPVAIPNIYSTPITYSAFFFLNTIAWAIDYAVRH